MNSTTDTRVVLAVIGFLGLFGLLGLAGMVWLIHDDTDPTTIAIISGPVSAALGALGALLASTRTTTAAVQEAKAEGYQQAVAHVDALGAAPQQVEVVNPPDSPVPTTETLTPPPNVDPANPRH